MRTRTAVITLVLAASVALVATASAAPAAATLPVASSAYRLGFARSTNSGLRARAIFSTAADGSDLRQASNSNGSTDDIDPAYSPDGTKLAYASGTANPDGSTKGTIMLADATGANAHAITSPGQGQSDDDPTWSPDGSMIAFDRLSPPSFDSGASTYQLYVLIVAGGTLVGPLVAQNWAQMVNPFWSPTDPNTLVATGFPNASSDRLVVRVSLLIAGANISVDSVTPLAGAAACEPPAPQVNDVLADTASTAQLFPTISPDGGTVGYLTNFSANGAACLVGINGSNARQLPMSNVTTSDGTRPNLRALAFSPDGTQLAVEQDTRTGVSILDATLNAPPATATSATAQTWIANAAAPAFDVQSGPVSLTVAADPAPGYVGGHNVAVKFTLKNQTSQTLNNAALVATLPATLPVAASSPGGCTPTACNLGNVPPGSTVVATFALKPAAAVSTLATGTVTFANAASSTVTVSGHGPLVVFAPQIAPNPAVGTPGFVTVVTGIQFPPHAKVRFTWNPGITAPTTVKVKADGTFTVQMLVLPNDDIGARVLTAHGLTGPAFGDATAPFLVQPDAPEPPRLVGGE
ncbi:MAG TPA: hypothetical protein VGJ28_12505 [Micromonosporaceae bacterium]|jgi:hypothetical protein